MNKLLIYIPTYNRFDFLVEQLAVLSKSIDEYNIQNINILVSDNASTDQRYLKIKERFPVVHVNIIRNRVNVGGVANVTRGFEYDEADYIWILSDDDAISSEALAVIAKEVELGQHDFYYLKSNIMGDDSVADGEVIQTQYEFLRKFSSFSMMGLISANIYPIRLNRYIEYMYLYGYTHFPHAAGTLQLMNNENFSLKCIGGNLVEWKPNRNSYSHTYEMVLSNALFLAELIKDRKNRAVFISKHLSDFGASHFFPNAIKNAYNFKKAWMQVGFRRLLLVGMYYVVVRCRSRIAHLIKLLFPKAYAWCRKYKAGR